MKLLLISNSGRPYLEHCKADILPFLKSSKRPAFVSAALFIDPEEYFRKVCDALLPAPFKLEHLNVDRDPMPVLSRSDALFVGGGNTYRLLKKLRETYLLDAIRDRVKKGMPYIGWSAGANVAGPTILTTNDWNVVSLTDFRALNLVPFSINPHYLETDPAMASHSETRDERIAEYHKANSNTVLGIEEQTSLWIEGDEIRVVGRNRVRRFEWNRAPVDYRVGDRIVL